MAPHLSNIALLYQKLGDLTNSLKYYEKALEVDQHANNISGVTSDFRRIGAILQDMKLHEKAVQMRLQALELDTKLGSLPGIAWDSANLGVIYLMQGDQKQANVWLQKALSLFLQLGANGEAAQVQNLLNDIHLKP